MYNVAIPGKGAMGNTGALVTATGSSNTACTVSNGTGGYNPAQVFCYDQSGNLADSTFSFLLQTPSKE